MKLRLLAVILSVLLLLTACGNAAGEKLESMENAVENKLESVENGVESKVDGLTDTAETTPEHVFSPETTVTQNTSGTITEEQAKTIALEHAGLTADQVQYLRVQYEIDDRIPQYEVEFHHERWEYDYEINAQTGEILSYDRDD